MVAAECGDLGAERRDRVGQEHVVAACEGQVDLRELGGFADLAVGDLPFCACAASDNPIVAIRAVVNASNTDNI